MGDHAVRHAVLADPGGEGTGVDAAEADDAARLKPLVEVLGGPVVRRIGDVGLEDDADRAVAGSRRQVFDVFLVRADIADVREGEGDDLAEIGWIGQNLLISRQRGVEADFGLDLTGRADTLAFDDCAIGENEKSSRLFGGPWGCRGHSHPVSGVVRGLEEAVGFRHVCSKVQPATEVTA
ncbi:hypothetical protein RHSP_48471 [Rhizobium freirei PRF 81]|uniref:Uncharacterized protein n=1 Tax=Rhizobium freirei PRF 81 TaxID=363754 RepID=N6UCJ2_9HYPH|nr:hypothetical protein RHSP_48471 [Rhizobium freirei PRF 81]